MKLRAFTLIELMVVVGIMGVIMGIGIPFAYRAMHKETLGSTVSEVQEVLAHARARAILQGQMVQVVIHPQERRLDVGGGGSVSAEEEGAAKAVSGGLPHGEGLSCHIPESLTIETCDVNGLECMNLDMPVFVRFYPNGTCDEFTLILHADNNQYRKISLEPLTSLAEIESDYSKFLR